MRTAHKVWGGIAAGVFGLVALSDVAGPPTTTAVAPIAAPIAVPAAPVAAPALTPNAPAAAAAPAPRPAAPARVPGTRSVIVDDVIDGDTFVAGGQKVRVLGIDSCEAGTDGGEQATSMAESMLEGQRVTLRSEPGVDRDRHGRQLRYVDLSSGSYAESMVVFGHTGVYAGRNDADEDYVQRLRDADPDGRTCTTPKPSSSDTDDEVTGGGSIDRPSPGDQGMRDGALTGGYCKKKWWC